MAEKAPSLTAVAVSSLILGLLAGYFIGQGSTIGVFGGSGGSQQAKKSWPNSYDVKVHADSSDDQADDEDEADESDEEVDGDGKELKDFKDSNEEVKLVLAVRTDLGMTKGEECFNPW
jgi:PTH2 family peptidyl-tRNA hydrolase